MSKQPETAAKPAAKPELHKVKLAKPHKHAGVEYPAGKSIDVSTPERDFLMRAGVVATPETTEGATPAAE